jgi:hypothetical protein
MYYQVKNKYNATRASYDGKNYHSAMERDDAIWLKSLVKEGEITELKEQVRYRIFVNGKHITDSIVDFQFKAKGLLVWYETKGFRTPEYRIKALLIDATIPEGEIYIVNAPDLMKFMRGRLASRPIV